MPTVDPDVQAVLDALAAGAYDTGKIDREETDEERRAAIDGDPLFARAAGRMKRELDIVIPGPHGEIPARVYIPHSRGGSLPVAMYFHGGGFHSGTLDMYDATCRDIARGSATVVVAVDYRLAPEFTFPIPLEDCYAATAWTAENAATWGADGSRLAVVGGSAGGNLAGAVALMARDKNGPRIAHQVLLFPAAGYDETSPSMVAFAEGYWLTADTVTYCWENYIPELADRTHPYASLIDAPDLSGLPSALVITAECDPLRDVGEVYAQKLADAGVSTRLSRYYGMIHGFTLMTGQIKRGRDALAEVAASLADALDSDNSSANRVAREDAREVVRQYFEDYLSHGDLDGADYLHGPTYTWHAPNGRALDRDKTSTFVRSLYAAHRDLTVEVHDLIAEGNTCVARFTMTGIQTGRWNGVAPQEQKLIMRGQIICTVTDGRMAEAWELIVQDEA